MTNIPWRKSPECAVFLPKAIFAANSSSLANKRQPNTATAFAETERNKLTPADQIGLPGYHYL
jgi:hypothetical protein